MTAYSGLFDGVYGTPYALQVGRNPLDRKLARTLKRRGMTRVREVIDTIKAGAKMNAVTVALPNDAFEYTNTDATVVVNHVAHGYNTGDVVIIAGATTVTGLTSGQVNGARTITVTGVDEYTFEAETTAGATDATAGGANITVTNNKAATTYKRVKEMAVAGDPTAGGGLVEIETVTQIASESNTTAADVQEIDDIVDFRVKPATYPVDLSGNGGGSKLAGVSY